MKKYINKDNSLRKKILKNENRRISLKVIQQCQFVSQNRRKNAGFQLSKMKRSSSLVRIKNRCVKTGRSRGVSKFFKLSRIMIKDLAAKNLLPNLQRHI
jgi:small subunit ribosomal protein S14